MLSQQIFLVYNYDWDNISEELENEEVDKLNKINSNATTTRIKCSN